MVKISKKKSTLHYTSYVSMDTGERWFQLDGATCHTSGINVLLREKFQGRLTSLRDDRQWPSCDLTPCDFFLRGFIKSLICANKPRTLLGLTHGI